MFRHENQSSNKFYVSMGPIGIKNIITPLFSAHRNDILTMHVCNNVRNASDIFYIPMYVVAYVLYGAQAKVCSNHQIT